LFIPYICSSRFQPKSEVCQIICAAFHGLFLTVIVFKFLE